MSEKYSFEIGKRFTDAMLRQGTRRRALAATVATIAATSCAEAAPAPQSVPHPEQGESIQLTPERMEAFAANCVGETNVLLSNPLAEAEKENERMFTDLTILC